YAECEGDCAEGDPDTNPDALEQCDEIDHDCDGYPQNDITTQSFYLDNDGDGYGDPNISVEDCAAPEGYIANAEDCDDDDQFINPAAAETFDGQDNDCDFAIDLEDADCEIIWTDCDEQEGSRVRQSEANDESCILEFSVALGDDGETPAYAELQAGSGIDVILWGDQIENAYYDVNIVDDQSGLHFESMGTETQIFIGHDQFYFGHEGTGYDLSWNSPVLKMTVTDPTVTAHLNPSGEEISSPDQLEELLEAKATEIGDTIEVTMEDDSITVEKNDEQVYPEETGDDDDDSADPMDDDDDIEGDDDDSSEKDPTGCECAVATAETPEVGGVMTRVAALLALIGLKRRRD
ncbi:MAG: putative metal-binding motif-containing protein, partial [Patescibacteria group bacterium]